MHGVQASTSPTDTRASLVLSTGHGTHTEHEQRRDGDHQHPGGQVCLGILALALFAAIVLALARWRRWDAASPSTRRRARRQGRHVGRSPPPPTVFQLAVLRL